MFLQYLLVAIASNVKMAVIVTIFSVNSRDSECYKAVVSDSEVYKADEVSEVRPVGEIDDEVSEVENDKVSEV